MGIEAGEDRIVALGADMAERLTAALSNDAAGDVARRHHSVIRFARHMQPLELTGHLLARPR